MRFNPITCPECGKQAIGTCGLIPGCAYFVYDEHDNVEYSGYTNLDWEGQYSLPDPEGDEQHSQQALQCSHGHVWWADKEEEA